MPGPQAGVTAFPDSFDTVNKTPVPTPPVNTYTKQINAGDAKVGPRKNSHASIKPINNDSYSE